MCTCNNVDLHIHPVLNFINILTSYLYLSYVQSDLNNNLVYHNEKLQETIDMLIQLLNGHGIDTSQLMEKQNKKLTSKPMNVSPRNDDQDYEHVDLYNVITEDDKDDIHVTVESLMRGAVVTAAAYVVLLAIFRRTPGVKQPTHEVCVQHMSTPILSSLLKKIPFQSFVNSLPSLLPALFAIHSESRSAMEVINFKEDLNPCCVF